MNKSQTCIRKKFDSHDSILKDYVYERCEECNEKTCQKREEKLLSGQISVFLFHY